MEKKIVFKYHPNVYDNDIIEHENGVCQCCGKEVNEYCSTMYCIDDVHCICCSFLYRIQKGQPQTPYKSLNPLTW